MGFVERLFVASESGAGVWGVAREAARTPLGRFLVAIKARVFSVRKIEAQTDRRSNEPTKREPYAVEAMRFSLPKLHCKTGEKPGDKNGKKGAEFWKFLGEVGLGRLG